MGRIRTIKPEFFQHEELFEAEIETGLPLRLAFIGLWTQCDKEGRFEWRPRRLKLNVLPWDDTDFSRVLDALATRGFIVKYASEGEEFGHIPSWRRHQAVNNRERESELPEPNENNELPTRRARDDDASSTRQGNYQGEGKGREGKGTRVNGAWHPPTVDEVREYVNARGSPVDPDKFHDFYTAKGWMVGKNKMKDWQAAVRTWERGDSKQRSEDDSWLPD